MNEENSASSPQKSEGVSKETQSVTDSDLAEIKATIEHKEDLKEGIMSAVSEAIQSNGDIEKAVEEAFSKFDDKVGKEIKATEEVLKFKE